MSLITRGMTDGTLITRGMGIVSSTISQISDWAKRNLWKSKGYRKLLSTRIIGNTLFPFKTLKDISSNTSVPYCNVLSVFGNNSVPISERVSLTGNYKRQFLFETKASGKKSFIKMFIELILDDAEED